MRINSLISCPAIRPTVLAVPETTAMQRRGGIGSNGVSDLGITK